MSGFERALTALDGWLGSAAYFPFILLGVGLFFTVYLRVPQLRFFAHGYRVLRGRYADSGAKGDANHFQALSTALSGTVGTGNIGGVAFALFLGGPAALFWMWMTAFLGMTTKFVEVTISHRYRTTDESGHIAGGPMYYMERGLNMRWLAICFAVATVVSSFGSGNLPQSNNMAAGLETSFDIPPAISGLVLAAVLGLVIVGGITRIAKVAAAIVPFMAVLYAFGALAVIGSNIERLIPGIVSVFHDAFTGSAAAGGFLGASIAYAFNRGVNRGLFSNEAGQGSAPIAHAAARTKEPVEEGMVAILEPFIDTLVICSLTGFAIICSGVWIQKHQTSFAPFDTLVVEGQYTEADPAHVEALFGLLAGRGSDVVSFTGTLTVSNGIIAPTDEPITILHNRSIAENVRVDDSGGAPYSGAVEIVDGHLTSDDVSLRGRSLLHSVPLTATAFRMSVLGAWGERIVTVGLVLFAFSTALAWSYYGDRAMTYLFGSGSVPYYRVAYVVGFFLATIADTSLIWLISAITLALMTLPNLLGIVLLRNEVRSLADDYWSRFKDRTRGA